MQVEQPVLIMSFFLNFNLSFLKKISDRATLQQRSMLTFQKNSLLRINIAITIILTVNTF